MSFYEEFKAWHEHWVPAHDRLVSYVMEGNPSRVLEFGCGGGKIALKTGAVGLDINREAIESARSKGVRAGLGDETTLQIFDDKEFDVAYTCSVLNHIKDDLPIRELLRVAKKVVVLESLIEHRELPQLTDQNWFRHEFSVYGLEWREGPFKEPIWADIEYFIWSTP